jgi:hypothetical protein
MEQGDVINTIHGAKDILLLEWVENTGLHHNLGVGEKNRKGYFFLALLKDLLYKKPQMLMRGGRHG